MSPDQSQPFAERNQSWQFQEPTRAEQPTLAQPTYAIQPRITSAPTNGFAIASLVLGIVWIYWLGSVLAVIFGHISLRQISRDNQSGRGLAIAGLVLGYVGIGILAVFLAILIAAAASTSSSDLGY